MLTVISLLVSFALTMASPAPVPTAPAPPAASGPIMHCPCPIGNKDWGK